MPGYKHPCRYCEKLIPPDSAACPLCGKVNPLGPLRCPKCQSAIEKGWKKCSHCGLSLEIDCPKCGKPNFLADYCQSCKARLTVICPNRKCKAEQVPIGNKCIKCGKQLK